MENRLTLKVRLLGLTLIGWKSLPGI